MSDLRLEEFVRRAEAAVALPDLSDLEGRGRRRRRGRALLAAAAVAVVALGSWSVVGGDPDPDVAPVDPPATPALPWPGNFDTQRVEPGVYAIELDRETTAAEVRFEVLEGWRSFYGPNLPHLRSGYVGLMLEDVERVATGACARPVSPMQPVGQSPARLVAALEVLPRHVVVSAPSPAVVDGLPATHLRLRRTAGAVCPGEGMFEVWDSPGTGGLVPSRPPGTVLDLWVVDVDGEAVLVGAVTGRGTPRWAKDELRATLASVEFVRGTG